MGHPQKSNLETNMTVERFSWSISNRENEIVISEPQWDLVSVNYSDHVGAGKVIWNEIDTKLESKKKTDLYKLKETKETCIIYPKARGGYV